MAEPGQVTLVNPKGELVYVSENDAQKALGQGFTQPDAAQQADVAKREQYGQGLGNELRAGVEGAVRGVLPIGADTLLSKIEDPEGIRERKERNPWSANIGMGAGIVASTLAAPESLLGRVSTLGVGGIAKAGGLAEHLVAQAVGEGGTSLAARAAAKMLSKGAGSAVEGAFYGLGEAVSEDALGESDITAQKVLAHMGMGAVFAGGAGTALAGLGELAGPLAGKAAEALQKKISESPALQAKLEQVAGEQGVIAATRGGGKKYYKKMLESNVKGLEGSALEGEDLTLFDEASRIFQRDHIVKAGMSQADIAAALKDKMQTTGEAIGQFTKDLDDAVSPKTEQGVWDAAKGDWKPEYVGPGQRALRSGKELGDGVEVVHAPSDTRELASGQRQVGSGGGLAPIEDTGDALTATGPGGGSAGPGRQPANADILMGDKVVRQGGASQVNLREFTAAVRKEVLGPLKQRPSMKGVLKTISDKIDDYDELADEIGDHISFAKAEELKRDLSEVFEKNAFGGTPDTALNKGLKQARGIMNTQIEDKARVAAELLGPDAFAKWKSLKRDYQALSLVNTAAQDRAAAIARNRVVSPSDMGAGIIGAVAAHGVAGPAGVAAAIGGAMANKILREHTSAVISDVANRVSKLAFLERASQKTSQAITSGVDKFVASLGSAKKLVAPASVGALHNALFDHSDTKGNPSREESYKRRLADLAGIVANPDSAVQRMSATMGTLESAAPKLAMALGARTMTAATFLYSKATKAPDTGGLLASQADWHPSDADMAKFERYQHAVQDPTSVLTDLKHGHVSAEAAEALQAVYPKLFQEIATQLVPKLAAQKNVPFAVRMQLSQLFGAPVDSMAQPQFIAAMQAVHKQAEIHAGPASPQVAGHSAILKSTQTPLQQAVERT